MGTRKLYPLENAEATSQHDSSWAGLGSNFCSSGVVDKDSRIQQIEESFQVLGWGMGDINRIEYMIEHLGKKGREMIKLVMREIEAI